MSRKKRRGKQPKSRLRGWVTVLLAVLLAFFALSIYLGHLGPLSRRPPVQSTAIVVPPPVVPDAGSPTLVVWNGCGEPGLAGRAARWLRRQGFDVFETMNADHMDYQQTLVVARSRRSGGARTVTEHLNRRLGIGLYVEQLTENPETDIVLILGKDSPDSLLEY